MSTEDSSLSSMQLLTPPLAACCTVALSKLQFCGAVEIISVITIVIMAISDAIVTKYFIVAFHFVSPRTLN